MKDKDYDCLKSKKDFIKDNNFKIINKKKNKAKKTVSIESRLIKRIKREFPKKKFIGDIPIKDEEYEILKRYLKKTIKRIANSYNHSIIDPVFATAIVQVGIRNYDGAFWRYVEDILSPIKITANYRKWVGESYYATLKRHNKFVLEKNNYVGSILMHGFVSDKYTNDFFDFLFAYYRIDLERDLERNNVDMMNSLIEIIMRNDNTDRTYLLVKHTQDAVGKNNRGAKIRIRRFLRLIDNCFWGQDVKLNKNNRLSRLFGEWKDNSIEFSDELRKYSGLGSFEKGKKRFTSPYIKCNLRDTSFNLVLPPQIIKTENPDNIIWEINKGNGTIIHNAQLYKAITGFKTEELIIELDAEDIFKLITINIFDEDNRLRLFKINKDQIRFFDEDGDLILKDNLPEGEVYSFTEDGYIPISDALIDSEILGDLVRSYFDLENGDIIRLPDGSPISIGKKIDEGLLHRGALNNIYGINETNSFIIYKKSPSILMKIQSQRVNGTVIIINGKKHRMFDINTTVLDLKDGSGDTGYLMNLADLGYTKDGIYNVYIDVPNDRKNRFWNFILINDITFEFEDAPYIFENRGSIRFNERMVVNPVIDDIQKNVGENSFNFDIIPDKDEIIFETTVGKIIVKLVFEIPVFKWSFDNENWYLQNPLDIWHYDFPTKIYFKYPEDKLTLFMDDIYETDEEQSVTYLKLINSGIIECDVTRFKSWFGREKKIREIYINMNNKNYEFIKVITRSYVTEKIIIGDYINKRLIGEFEITGNSTYYVDIIFDDHKIADKQLINDGKISITDKLTSGKYKIIIFEEEDDDSGFGDKDYLHMFEFYQELINPYDLTGKDIELKFIKTKGEIFKKDFKEKYIINDLSLIDNSDQKTYLGLIKKESDKKDNSKVPVKVRFDDLNNLKFAYINFLEDDEYIEFLFDESMKTLVRYEEEGLRASVRYRKYSVIYEDDYLFGIEFN